MFQISGPDGSYAYQVGTFVTATAWTWGPYVAFQIAGGTTSFNVANPGNVQEVEMDLYSDTTGATWYGSSTVYCTDYVSATPTPAATNTPAATPTSAPATATPVAASTSTPAPTTTVQNTPTPVATISSLTNPKIATPTPLPTLTCSDPGRAPSGTDYTYNDAANTYQLCLSTNATQLLSQQLLYQQEVSNLPTPTPTAVPTVSPDPTNGCIMDGSNAARTCAIQDINARADAHIAWWMPGLAAIIFFPSVFMWRSRTQTIRLEDSAS